jgi:hypothetical protein
MRCVSSNLNPYSKILVWKGKWKNNMDYRRVATNNYRENNVPSPNPTQLKSLKP